MTSTLLHTVHGSRLYGLSHPRSDHDTYTVVEGRRRPRQLMRGTEDRLVIGLDEFLGQCAKSVPQALEAMFSPMATTTEVMEALRAGYRVGAVTFRQTYSRTVVAFAAYGVENDDAKRRRHALRLLLNLEQGLAYGRFNPRLTPDQALWVRRHADSPNFQSVVEAALPR